MLEHEKISDQQIIILLEENNLLAWEKLYDKYAAAMFGLICNLTNDKTLAEEIFITAFLQLKENQILSKVKFSLYPTLLRHTFSYTTKRLKALGINPKIYNPLEEVKLIHLLSTQCNSIKEVASIFNMTEEETKKKLRAELLNLRNQKQSVETPQSITIMQAALKPKIKTMKPKNLFYTKQHTAPNSGAFINPIK